MGAATVPTGFVVVDGWLAPSDDYRAGHAAGAASALRAVARKLPALTAELCLAEADRIERSA